MSAPVFQAVSAALIPGRRATPDSYWLALGVIALIDGVRISVLDGPGALFSWLIVLFFVASAHLNRLRDAARPALYASAPVFGGAAVKFLVGLGVMSMAIFPLYRDFAEARGIDMNDPQAVNTAFADPALQRAFQEMLLADPQLAARITAAGDWPSTLAFWIVIFVGARWFARLDWRAA